MTELRAPKTFADAMTRVAGVIGWPTAAGLVGRRERAVRYWSETGCKTTPTLAQALALDAAYEAAGGEGSPFLDAFAFQRDVRIERRDACRRSLAAEVADAAREGGEAIAHTIKVATSNASPCETYRAISEADQAYSAWGRILRRLNSFLPTGAGPAAGLTGGTAP